MRNQEAEWFKRYRPSEKPAHFDRIVQSWDTANKATELSDYSVCTTWGVKGKELFLLAVFRQRLEYPALKRAVREQQSLCNATVVLIEDKASGTQLIQELVADGCHGVTRYQPTTDKVMRLHAQTALIENGFVRIPEAASWLAEYLHELTVFPKGKYDDQADSTAQFLDWYKKPGPNDGYFEWLRMEAEAIRGPEKVRKRIRVLLKEQPDVRVQSIQTFSNRHLEVPPDRMIEVSAEDADSLIRQGWQKLGELPEDELPGGPDEYFKPINEPQGPKVNYAVGSMECQAQIKKERIAREAAEEVRKQIRVARVAALLERGSHHAAE